MESVGTEMYVGNHNYYKRKPRFNWKILLSLFIIGLGVLLGFMGIGSVLDNDDNFLEVTLSQDLKLDENESLYKLILDWPALEEDTYEQIYLTVGEEEIILSPTATSFEMNLYEPDTEYEIEFRAKRQGFGFSKVDKQLVATLGNNEILQQDISNLRIEEDYLIFEHTFTLPESWVLDQVYYELTDLWEGKAPAIDSQLLESTDKVGIFQITVPLTDLAHSQSLSLSLHLNQEQTSILANVTDTEKVIRESYGGFTLYVDKGQFVLLNDNFEQYTYESHQFFSESFHPVIQEPDEIFTYQLMSLEGETVVDEPYLDEANLAIDLSQLEPGRYFVMLNEMTVRVNQLVHDVWYTVTREGLANRITVDEIKGLLVLRVDPVNQLPENVYDILIDPGHGGMDGGAQGNGLSEAEEVLKLSEYITKRLEDHGLKVKMSRTGDYEPSGDDTFDGLRSPYFDKGRVSQVYEHQVKYVISNHLNAFSGEFEGFELYSSIFTTDYWTEAIARELVASGHIARDSLMADGRVSEGSFKRSSPCTYLRIYDQLFGCPVSDLDQLYMIRETGGPKTFAAEMVYFNPNFHTEIPNFGAQTVLIEFAYIDNVNDATAWRQSWEDWGEAVVKATLDYLEIEYDKS